MKQRQKLVSEPCMGRKKTMRMASRRESQVSDRFLVNTQVQSHALLHRGFGTSVPFICFWSHHIPSVALLHILSDTGQRRCLQTPSWSFLAVLACWSWTDTSLVPRLLFNTARGTSHSLMRCKQLTHAFCAGPLWTNPHSCNQVCLNTAVILNSSETSGPLSNGRVLMYS